MARGNAARGSRGVPRYARERRASSERGGTKSGGGERRGWIRARHRGGRGRSRRRGGGGCDGGGRRSRAIPSARGWRVRTFHLRRRGGASVVGRHAARSSPRRAAQGSSGGCAGGYRPVRGVFVGLQGTPRRDARRRGGPRGDGDHRGARRVRQPRRLLRRTSSRRRGGPGGRRVRPIGRLRRRATLRGRSCQIRIVHAPRRRRGAQRRRVPSKPPGCGLDDGSHAVPHPRRRHDGRGGGRVDSRVAHRARSFRQLVPGGWRSGDGAPAGSRGVGGCRRRGLRGRDVRPRVHRASRGRMARARRGERRREPRAARAIHREAGSTHRESDDGEGFQRWRRATGRLDFRR